MGKTIKCSYELCNTCKYHTIVNCGWSSKTNVACYYNVITGFSRVVTAEGNRIEPGTCDKYEKGSNRYVKKGWDSDDMTFKSSKRVKAGLSL